MKYRKKPIIIEAEQWNHHGDSVQVVILNSHNHALCEHCGKKKSEHGWIRTLEGGHIVCPGDWIIKGVMGEFYPCKPDIFKMTYELPDGGEIK